jgi:hypothetical protein
MKEWKYAPYPEIADPGETGYHVASEEVTQDDVELGRVNRKDRKLVIKLDENTYKYARQALGRARWGPEVYPNYCNDNRPGIQMTEVARINHALHRKDMPPTLPEEHADQVLSIFYRMLEMQNMVAAGLLLIGYDGTEYHEMLMEKLDQWAWDSRHNRPMLEVLGPMYEVRRRLFKGMSRAPEAARFSTAESVGRWAIKRLYELQQEHYPGGLSRIRKGVAQCMKVSEQPIPQDYRPSRTALKHEQVDEWRSRYSHNRHGSALPKRERHYDRKKGAYWSFEWEDSAPGTMTIERPERTINVVPPRLQRERKWRPNEEGVVFQNIDRYVSDQRVFRCKRKKRVGGGSVLVDISGSMSLTDEDILEIVKGSPDATLVATYCGRGRQGVLTIVVDAGLMTDEVSPQYGGNIIDIPALEWLACQPPPRVWLSDGLVTGTGDHHTAELVAASKYICVENYIKRCESLTEARDVLRRQFNMQRYEWCPPTDEGIDWRR